MKNANLPAAPIGQQLNMNMVDPACNGLTKREHFAAIAPEIPSWYNPGEINTVKRYFGWRCYYADSLLAVLEK